MADVVFTAEPSVAVTVMLYGSPTMLVGTVVGVIVTVAVATLLESAWEVAVIVALPGRPTAIVGALYATVKPFGVIDPPVDGLIDQVTPWVEFVTVAVNDAVWFGQLEPARPFGYRVDPSGLTLTPTAGALLLPQATSNPRSTSDAQRATIAEYLDVFRPANPAKTMPASGNAKGSNGERLSARRRRFLFPPLVLGPAVLMVTVAVAGDVVVAVIVGMLQVTPTIPAGRLQAKVTGLVKVAAPASAVTVKVDVAGSPASTGDGEAAVGLPTAKF